ncbi:MAG: DUF4062 domain-containing protein [Tissierellaceae bacterium]
MISIFVSSTFKDMQAERDMLNIYVLPEIREHMRAYGEEVSFIDLRWGINTEALEGEESSRKILSVCLDEIDKSKPYFIAFLGDRYGWIPEESLIKNALKEKDGELSYLAVDKKSVTALEIEYGALHDLGLIDHCLFYFREPFNTEGLEEEYKDLFSSESEVHKKRLDALKARIVNGGAKPKNYNVYWDEKKNQISGLEKLKEQIIKDLKDLIDKDFKDVKRLSWQEQAMVRTNLLFKQKLRLFSARKDLANEIENKILSQTTKLVTIRGEMGFGKTTMIAKLRAKLEEARAKAVPIVCGQDSITTYNLDVLRQLAFALEGFLGKAKYTIDDGPEYRPGTLSKDWITILRELIYECKDKFTEPIIVFIDGAERLNDFENFKDSLKRLLGKLSNNIVFVISLGDEDLEISSKLNERIRQTSYILEEIGQDERKLVIEKLESLEYRKELALEVKDKIISLEEAKNPFYLSLMYQRMLMLDREDFKEIVRLGDGLQGQISFMLDLVKGASKDVSGLSAEVMIEAADRINSKQCREILKLIAVSRRGLRESDLQNIFRQTGKEYVSIDFYVFHRYMDQYFYQLNDGRINFTNESFRLGILKNIREAELKEIQEEIFSHLKTLYDNEPVFKDEFTWLAWKLDKKNDLLKKLEDYNLSLNYTYDMDFSYAKGFYDVSLQDKGKWLIELLKSYDTPVAVERIINIVRFQFIFLFELESAEVNILLDVLIQAMESSRHIAIVYRTETSIVDLRALPYFIGQVFEKTQKYDKALEYYNENVKVYDEWGEDDLGKKFIYVQIGNVYKELKDYHKSLEYYNMAAEEHEILAKKAYQILFFELDKLTKLYEIIANIYEILGDFEKQGLYERKANEIKELQNTINDAHSHDYVSGSGFWNHLLFKNNMDNGTEELEAGDIQGAMESYKNAFEILENQFTKWHKEEDLSYIGGLYMKLANEFEALGTEELHQECSRKANIITETLSGGNDGVKYYTDFETRWYKF